MRADLFTAPGPARAMPRPDGLGSDAARLRAALPPLLRPFLASAVRDGSGRLRVRVRHVAEPTRGVLAQAVERAAPGALVEVEARGPRRHQQAPDPIPREAAAGGERRRG